jgi:hypothetical protein
LKQNQNFNNMKKLIFLVFCLFLLISCSAQTFRKYSYGLDLPGYKLNGTQLTSTFAQLNYLNTMTGNVKTALDGKQATLVNGVNFSTINGQSILTGTNLVISGTGTVTSLSITTANGISGSVVTPTSTPAITLTLGAITPTSIRGVIPNALSTGFTLSGGTSVSKTLTVPLDASVSGTNTGDNAVNNNYASLVTNANHSGDAVGSTTLTIQPGVVTLAKMADVATATVFYRKTAGTGSPEVQTLAQLKTDLGLIGTNSGDQTNITGNAATATKLAATHTLNGVAVDFSTNYTIPSDIAPGTIGNVLTSLGNGLWASQTPASISAVTSRIDSIVTVLKAATDATTLFVAKHGTITPETSGYSLQLADDGATIQMNVASANNLTVPLNSSQAFPIGSLVYIECIGAGKTTVVATGGVTIISKGSLLGITVKGDAALHKIDTNTWKLIGSLE